MSADSLAGQMRTAARSLLADQEVSPAPVFLGANPACVSYAGRPVSRPQAGHPGAGIGSPNRPRRRLPGHPPALMTRAKYVAPLAQPETKWPTGRQTS